MLPLAICILLISLCFAHDHHSSHIRPSQSHSENLADSPEIPHSHHRKHPVTAPKFVYNYKQMRANQEAQVKQREDGKKYVNSDNVITTPKSTLGEIIEADDATVVDKMLETAENKQNHNHHHHHHPKQPKDTNTIISNVPEKQEVNLVHNLDYQRFHPAYLPIVPPPPALPQWKEINDFFKQLPRYQNKESAPKTPEHDETYIHTSQHEPTMPTKIVAHTNVKTSKEHTHVFHDIPKLTSKNENVVSTTVKSVSAALPSDQNAKSTHHHVHRGNHKHKTEVLEALVSISTSTSGRFQNKLPPPPPTLSPWYDGFGK